MYFIKNVLTLLKTLFIINVIDVDNLKLMLIILCKIFRSHDMYLVTLLSYLVLCLALKLYFQYCDGQFYMLL